jgi:CRP-like cAMP-binding protein
MSVIDRRRGPRCNRILQALPAEDRDRLIRNMVPVSLPIKTVLFEPGEPIRAVYFPLGGVISLVTPLDDGAIVEVATVGNEGIVGVPLVPGGSLAVRAISQVSGSSLRMEPGAFLSEVRRAGAFSDLFHQYLQIDAVRSFSANGTGRPGSRVTSHGSTKPLIVGFLTRMTEIVAPLRSSVAA